MEISSQTIFRNITIRVSDRDLELDFYHNILGFDILLEENALATLGISKKKAARIVLEETPEGRKVIDGIQKLKSFSLKIEKKVDFINILKRMQKAEVIPHLVWTYKNSCGLRVTDFEQNNLQIYYSNDPSFNLEQIEKDWTTTSVAKFLKDEPDDKKTDYQFIPLEDAYITTLELNVLNLAKMQNFYEKLFAQKFTQKKLLAASKNSQFSLILHEAKGSELVGKTNELLDIEYIEFSVSKNEQATFRNYFEQEKLLYFQTGDTLVVVDSLEIEWWFIAENKKR